MTRRNVKAMALLLAFTGLMQSPALANGGRRGHRHPADGGPPPEAFEAFRDKNDSDPVECIALAGDRIRFTRDTGNSRFVRSGAAG